MRLATDAVQNLLNTWTPTTVASIKDLYIFTLITGEVFRFAAHQTGLYAPPPLGSSDITEFFYGGFGYPTFNRSKVKVQVGPQIDELEIEFFVDQNDVIVFGITAEGGSLTWQKAFQLGAFDGAMCELRRAFISGPVTASGFPNVVGTVTMFYGRVGDIEIGRSRSIIHVKSLLDELNIQMPRRLFQASCNHVFGQPGTGMCGYNRLTGQNADGAFTGVGQVPFTCVAGSSQATLFTEFVPAAPGSYDNGTVVGTSGLNYGFSRSVGQLINGAVLYLLPWFFPVVAETDTFVLYPGCDHTLNTCTNVFLNQDRYGGFPYIPPPETAI